MDSSSSSSECSQSVNGMGEALNDASHNLLVVVDKLNSHNMAFLLAAAWCN
jgi:hypothetical protein